MARKSSRPGRSRLRDDVADRLHSAAVHLLRRLRREDARAGLSAARLSALSVLVSGGPRTLGELAGAEQVTAPTMSRIIAAMEHDGFVRRQPHPHDRRAVILTATARGHRAMDQARRTRIVELAGRIQSLPASEVRLLDEAAAVMERLAE